MNSTIIPAHPKDHISCLSDHDPPDFDQKYVKEVKEEIENVVLPLFDIAKSL